MTDLSTDTLLGVADLARLLGRSQRTVGGWRARGIVCDSEIIVDTRGTLIWRASTVLAHMAAKGYYDGPIPEPMALPELVSYPYLETVTGYQRRTLHSMADRLPTPDLRLSTIPLWLKATVDEWAQAQKVAT